MDKDRHDYVNVARTKGCLFPTGEEHDRTLHVWGRGVTAQLREAIAD